MNKDTLFRPNKSEAKADTITRIVRDMTEADTSAREEKSRRLRAARLEREASEKARNAASPQTKPQKRTVKAKPVL